MDTKYVPILRAMKGDAEAINRAKPVLLGRVLPLFDVPKPGDRGKQRANRPQKSTAAVLDNAIKVVASVRGVPGVMVDAFQWLPGDTTEDGEHVVEYFVSGLRSSGMRVIPVIGYDRWESPPYQAALQRVIDEDGQLVCVRFDSEATGDAREPKYFAEQVRRMLAAFDLEPERCVAVLDFGDVCSRTVDELIADGRALLNALAPMRFGTYATAGSSMPPIITKAVGRPGTTAIIDRKEMFAWEALKRAFPDITLVFGDYGVRGPRAVEAPVSNANGKIRHTIQRRFFIARGSPLNAPPYYEQNFALARKVADSQHFLGEAFSWGDAQIAAASRRERSCGSAQTWVTIDTNHHVAFAVLEVLEFERQNAVTATVR